MLFSLFAVFTSSSSIEYIHPYQEINITIPYDTVLVAVNPESFEGKINELSVFGLTNKFILNCSKTEVLTVRNPSSVLKSFVYEKFALSNRCNFIQIVKNPDSNFKWTVSSHRETRNVTMDDYQSYCFWFVWEDDHSYLFKLENNGLDPADYLRYTTTPSVTYYNYVYSTSEISASYLQSFAFFFSTDFWLTYGSASFSVQRRAGTQPQEIANSLNMVCVSDSNCQWREYIDNPISEVDPAFIALIVGVVVLALLFIIASCFLCAYLCGWTFCCGKCACCISITTYRARQQQYSNPLLSPQENISYQQSYTGQPQYAQYQNYPEQPRYPPYQYAQTPPMPPPVPQQGYSEEPPNPYQK